MSSSSRIVAGRPRVSQSSEALMRPATDLVEYLRSYCQQEPEVAALWCLGIGFVLGWKLKFW